MTYQKVTIAPIGVGTVTDITIAARELQHAVHTVDMKHIDIHRPFALQEHDPIRSLLRKLPTTSDDGTWVTVILDQVSRTSVSTLNSVSSAITNWSAANPDAPVAFHWVITTVPGGDNGSNAHVYELLKLI